MAILEQRFFKLWKKQSHFLERNNADIFIIIFSQKLLETSVKIFVLGNLHLLCTYWLNRTRKTS